MYEDLKNKVIIIAGGSRGIGKEIAKHLLELKAIVFIFARTESELKQTYQELKQYGRLIAKPANAANAEEVSDYINMVLSEFRKIDVLINCVGVQGKIGPFHKCNLNEWEDTFLVNIRSVVYTCRAVLTSMIERKQGKIINFSGGGATGPRTNFSAYAIAKTGIVRFTETLAREVFPYNIQVNAVAPGAVNTRMLDEILAAGEEKAGKEYQQAIQRKKEGGVSANVAAELVTYLASDRSDWLTGKLIAAPWDPWREWVAGKTGELNDNMYTLRRVDGTNIGEIKV